MFPSETKLLFGFLDGYFKTVNRNLQAFGCLVDYGKPSKFNEVKWFIVRG